MDSAGYCLIRELLDGTVGLAQIFSELLCAIQTLKKIRVMSLRSYARGQSHCTIIYAHFVLSVRRMQITMHFTDLFIYSMRKLPYHESSLVYFLSLLRRLAVHRILARLKFRMQNINGYFSASVLDVLRT